MRVNILAGALALSMASSSMLFSGPAFRVETHQAPPPNSRNDRAASRQRAAKKRRKNRSKRK